MRATDATQFLSTAAVLFTIFLTVAAGALISGLPRNPAELAEPDPGDNVEKGFARAMRSLLFDLVVLNAIGVLLPFSCLFAGVFVRLPTWLLIVCFGYTTLVFLTNLAAVLLIKFAPRLYAAAMRKRGETEREDAGHL
ncbi:hypothetical protein FKR81_34885 [Lentzea tibetensis]|uniref:Uncharacterized protein n=1 Tax=Lentzea tibetensis TaxID=2591470 RepID=A0A563EJE4_9PSEU|nr:hypothetical protein [Lentzea tibetensis]TWP46773.1 hypothetical protein FKR81_34885 [Lentzea tibetensis]